MAPPASRAAAGDTQPVQRARRGFRRGTRCALHALPHCHQQAEPPRSARM